jgi:peroxiredoxin
LIVGHRPESLEPGRTLTPESVEQSDRAATLGAAAPGRLQLLLFERGHWCAACRRHLALISDGYDAFSERKIDIVAVTHESVDAMSDRIYSFPLFADPLLELAARFDLTGIDEFGVPTIRPSTIIARHSGEIVFSYVGDDSRDRPTIPALLLAIDNLT